MQLNNLKFLDGSKIDAKRIARGIGGRRTGRGRKGQKSRSGVSLSNFQGGQNPIERRTPKHGNFLSFKKAISISLEKLDLMIENNLITSDQKIDKNFLNLHGLISKNKLNYKLKFIGKTKYKLNLVGNAVSSGAKASIESQSGAIEILEK